MTTLDNKTEIRQKTAIVIDDDKDNVSVFSEFLQLKGMEVIGRGYDGREGYELCKRLKPDVVFLDVMMDRYDGFYALEKIRAIEQNAVVIMVTADLTKDTEDRLNKLDASAIIYKPYDIDQIIQVVDKLVPKKIETAKLSR
jgi:two-component system, chemotaxis family, chemotaxis protein CheY